MRQSLLAHSHNLSWQLSILPSSPIISQERLIIYGLLHTTSFKLLKMLRTKHLSEVIIGPILPFSHKTRRPFSMEPFARLKRQDIVSITILILEHYSCSKPETMPMPRLHQEIDYLAFIQIFKACLLTHNLLIVIHQLAAM